LPLLLLLLAWNLPRFARSAAPSVLTVQIRTLSNQLVSMLLQQLQQQNTRQLWQPQQQP
jgi:hypothetical protein